MGEMSKDKLENSKNKILSQLTLKHRVEVEFEHWNSVDESYTIAYVWLDFVSHIGDGKFIGKLIESHASIIESYNFQSEYFELELDTILRVRADDIEWMIDNFEVSVTEKVYNGEKVGYFFNICCCLVNHYGRYFYGVSEMKVPKRGLANVTMPLKKLMEQQPELKCIIDCNALEGVLYNGKEYKALTYDEAVNLPRSQYPWALGDIFE
jgi:hypothetical protein